jgi:hypothetical protein
MSPGRRDRSRTQPCGALEAEAKLRRARQFMEVAAMIADDPDPDPDWLSAAAALAILAGISASDAACCKALGRRSRGQDHHDAETLLEQVHPNGKAAATSMRRLISLKDEAHYGFFNIRTQDLKSAFTQANKLLRFASSVVTR